jgi:hypothetical protein
MGQGRRPAGLALYARVVVKHPDNKAIAVGHAMRKLLHLAFAVWKTGMPFDPEYAGRRAQGAGQAGGTNRVVTRDTPLSQESQAAGLKRSAQPARKEVTAACTATVAEIPSPGESPYIKFVHLKKQLTMAQVLDQLGLLARGAQRKGPCPLHRGDGRGKTFSVNLDKNVFHCFDAGCGKKGDVIDLWAALHGVSLRQAAIDLVNSFHLEPAPERSTEKRPRLGNS